MGANFRWDTKSLRYESGFLGFGVGAYSRNYVAAEQKQSPGGKHPKNNPLFPYDC